MGAACCCINVDYEDYLNPSSNVYRNCVCIRGLLLNVLNMYASLFRRGQQHAPLPTTVHGTATTSLDNTICDIYRSPPRPLPYDVDPRYFRLRRENSSHDKGSSHSHEETETQPLRRKWNEDEREQETKECHNRSSIKLSTEKAAIGFAHIYSSSLEDEDVCPTCLEEYTSEDPKIIMKCCHHFHLGCIYEWMERSESCPVCGKAMEFDETQ